MTADATDPDLARAQRYSSGAILLHWLTVAAIVVQLALAWRMDGPRSPATFEAFQLHKSVGITILVLTLARIGWRLGHPPPPLAASIAPWERLLARITHAGFYVILIAMPLTGWLTVSASPLRLPTLLYGTIPWPDLPGLAHLPEAARKPWRQAGAAGHEALALLLLGLLALHVGGALKHQFLDREAAVLGRMLPGARPGRWLEPRLLLVVAGLAAALALGLTIVMPRASRPAPPPTPSPAAPATPATTAPAAAPAVPQTPAPVADTQAAAEPPTAAEPVRWKVQPGSSLGFRTSWSGSDVEGRFGTWEADILFSPDALDRSRVKVDIDLATADTGDAQRDASLRGEEWFDAAAHPRATFTAQRFEAAGPGRYVAHGRLTLRGVSREVSLPFRLKIDGDTARVSGVTSLDRTAFGVGQGEWKNTDQIPGKVTVSLDIKARRN